MIAPEDYSRGVISRATDQRVDAGFSALAAKARKAVIGAGGGAFCVHLEGRCVVDIWAGERDPAIGSVWERDTMAMAWSTTKGVASTALHMLVDQGLLGYNDTVATFWPEFAAAGKGSTTIRQVMAMEAGLYDVRHLVADPRLLMDHEVMATALAAASPRHKPGAANAYHAFTYGWIIGELVRRLTGESLGRFVERRIAQPLGLDGFHIGTPTSQLPRVAARPVLRPEPAVLAAVAKAADPPMSLLGLSPRRVAAAFVPRNGHQVIGTDEFLTAEVPSVNGTFTARSLSRFYGALADDEGIDGVRLWSPRTRRQATQQQNDRRDLIIPIRAGWLLGYHRPFPRRRTGAEAFGFYGAYGSGGFADPDLRLGVGLVVQEASGFPMAKLAAALYKTLDA